MFDEGYGSKVPFLLLLDAAGRRFVGEVPVSFSVRTEQGGRPRRADGMLAREEVRRGGRWRQRRESLPDAWWRWRSVPVWVRDRQWLLVAAINEGTGELKYFVANARGKPVARVLEAAFRRATVEHGFRLAKQEAGQTHYEGRLYTGLRGCESLDIRTGDGGLASECCRLSGRRFHGPARGRALKPSPACAT